MNLWPSGAASYSLPEAIRRKLRYAWVSLAFLPVGQGLLLLLGRWLDDYVTASVLAASIAAVPNFFANRHLVWRDRSGRELHRQILVFWFAVMLGVSLATAFTYLVERLIADHATVVRGAAVLCAQVIGFGIVWVGRFLVLDRWLFKGAEYTHDPKGAKYGDVPACATSICRADRSDTATSDRIWAAPG